MLLTDKDLGVSVRLGLLVTAATVFVSQWYAIPAAVPAAAPFVVLLAIVGVRIFVAIKGAANTTADEKLDAAEDAVVELADKLTPEQLAVATKAAEAVRLVFQADAKGAAAAFREVEARALKNGGK